MSKKFFVNYKLDYKFLISILTLVVIGLIMVYSASYFEIGYKSNDQSALFKKELAFVLFGISFMLFLSNINYKIIEKLVVPINIVTIISYILLIPIFGVSINFRGAIRWIDLGVIQIMPSDIAKYATIISIAYLIGNKRSIKEKNNYADLFVFVCPFIYFIGTLLQPDLSTLVVIFGSAVLTLYFGALNSIYILIMTIVGSLSVSAYIFFNENRLDRVKVFFDPFLDPSGDGYQVIQSLIAVASGGLTGVGIGNSNQKMLYLPLSYNDYIFAIYAEEFGFVGSVILIIALSALVLRGLKIAFNAPDKFSTLLVGGIISQIAIQSIINLYVSVNLLPSTGINLPIISYGGTSLITTLGALGLVLSVSRFENKTIPTAFKPIKDKEYYSLESRENKK